MGGLHTNFSCLDTIHDILKMKKEEQFFKHCTVKIWHIKDYKILISLLFSKTAAAKIYMK